MKIIEKRDPEIEHTCRDCKSKLAVNITDIRHQTVSCMGDIDDNYQSTCPVCGSTMSIGSSSIPYGWKAQLRARKG